MWPECLKQLRPFPNVLQTEPPTDLAAVLRQQGWPVEVNEWPIRLVALLGICSTDRFAECPTLPQWHIENAAAVGDKSKYLANIGRYFWCDFDLFDAAGKSWQLRLAFNEGDADCNDGTWGIAYDRQQADMVAYLTSVGDGEGRVTWPAAPQPAFTAHAFSYLLDNDQLENSRLPFTLEFANHLELEQLIGIAMHWCIAYRD